MLQFTWFDWERINLIKLNKICKKVNPCFWIMFRFQRIGELGFLGSCCRLFRRFIRVWPLRLRLAIQVLSWVFLSCYRLLSLQSWLNSKEVWKVQFEFFAHCLEHQWCKIATWWQPMKLFVVGLFILWPFRNGRNKAQALLAKDGCSHR